MPRNSKRYQAHVEKVPAEPVGLGQAVELLKSFGDTKFDQSVEIHMRLGVDDLKRESVRLHLCLFGYDFRVDWSWAGCDQDGTAAAAILAL